MSKKPTLTERVTHLEEALAAASDHAHAVDRRASYTELSAIQFVEDARKARQDARVAQILATAAIALSIISVLTDAL